MSVNMDLLLLAALALYAGVLTVLALRTWALERAVSRLELDIQELRALASSQSRINHLQRGVNESIRVVLHHLREIQTALQSGELIEVELDTSGPAN